MMENWHWYLASCFGTEVKEDAWLLWMLPSLILGAVFVTTIALLTAIEGLFPGFWSMYELPRKRSDQTQKAEPSFWARALPLIPVVIRNLLLSAPTFWIAWNVRMMVAHFLQAEWFSIDNSYSYTYESTERTLQAGYLAVIPLTEKIGFWPGLLIGGFQLFAEWSWASILAQVWMLHVISQLIFWSMHRLVHAFPLLFRIVHAQHHRHMEPFALTAIHCSIWEMWMLNIPAVLLGPLILKPCFTAHVIWMALAGLYTPFSHSGRQAWLMDVSYHDDHHRYLKGNFGSDPLDRLFGTRLLSDGTFLK